jgi:hypothetical protein
MFMMPLRKALHNQNKRRLNLMTDKTKMIYNDDKSIGVDEQSLKQLMNILTPRMQKQLVESVHNNLADELNNTIPPAVNPEL